MGLFPVTLSFSKLKHIERILKPALQNFFMQNMSSNEEWSDHMTKTAHTTRAPNVSDAIVTEIKTLSPTVKGLTLKIQDDKFDFKAGQWVDLFIPGVTTFTGFTICSSPHQLTQNRTLGLSIKAADYPPTLWVHTKCHVGSEVTLRVGGEFYYDPRPGDPPIHLLLLAGGLGINPMLSMLLHYVDINNQKVNGDNALHTGKVTLLFSAGCEEEIIFKNILDECCTKYEDIQVKYFVTREEPKDPNIKVGRICAEDLESAIELMTSETDQLQAYICGPSAMIDSMESNLLKLEVPKKHIHYEKWW